MLYLQDIWGIQLVYLTSRCYYFKIKIHKKKPTSCFFLWIFFVINGIFKIRMIHN